MPRARLLMRQLRQILRLKHEVKFPGAKRFPLGGLVILLIRYGGSSFQWVG